MSFSAPSFLFAFMPIFFAAYFAVPAKIRNAVLLAGSLLFYSMDGGPITIVLIGSIAVNYAAGILIERSSSRVASGTLAFGVGVNLLPLLYYKYWNFIQTAAHDAGTSLGYANPVNLAHIVLPAGISFFTFQGISYLIDIYRREIKSAPSLLDFGMYHTLFPQLVAGPIVRYREVEDKIVERPLSFEDVEQGIMRFCIGIAKKIVIADNMGVLADRMFGLDPSQLTGTCAWIGAIAYTLQIFFDFSGYSDMAIGLGRILGFRFPENFDQPYCSLSITEFWRRWHMTLSRWFRDYLYIPMGGNRAGKLRTYVNLFMVFVLCGLWHGAAYTFLAWGLFHGGLLVIERANKSSLKISAPWPICWATTMMLVIIGWVFFRSASMEHALIFLKAMSGLSTPSAAFDAMPLLTADKITFFVVGIALALRPPNLNLRWSNFKGLGSVSSLTRQSIAFLLFAYSAILVAANGFNPFIYFRF